MHRTIGAWYRGAILLDLIEPGIVLALYTGTQLSRLRIPMLLLALRSRFRDSTSSVNSNSFAILYRFSGLPETHPWRTETSTPFIYIRAYTLLCEDLCASAEWRWDSPAMHYPHIYPQPSLLNTAISTFVRAQDRRRAVASSQLRMPDTTKPGSVLADLGSDMFSMNCSDATARPYPVHWTDIRRASS